MWATCDAELNGHALVSNLGQQVTDAIYVVISGDDPLIVAF